MAFGSVNVPGKLTAEDVGAVPISRKVNSKTLSSDISLTAKDVGARPSSWTPTAADVGAVPTTRKVNNKALSGDISLTAVDVGARPSSWMPTAIDVGAAASNHTHTAADVGAAASGHNHDTQYYTKTETDTKLSGKSNTGHTHSASDVGAAASNHSHSASDVGAVPTSRKINNKTLSKDISLTASDVGASASGHTHSGYVPTTRKVNNKALNGDISLTSADVGAAPSGHSHTASQVGALPITGGTLTGNLRIQSSNSTLQLGNDDTITLSKATNDVFQIHTKSILFDGMGIPSTKPLPINQGGTGVTTIEQLREALGLGTAPLDVLTCENIESTGWFFGYFKSAAGVYGSGSSGVRNWESFSGTMSGSGTTDHADIIYASQGKKLRIPAGSTIDVECTIGEFNEADYAIQKWSIVHLVMWQLPDVSIYDSDCYVIEGWYNVGPNTTITGTITTKTDLEGFLGFRFRSEDEDILDRVILTPEMHVTKLTVSQARLLF